jgi:hypothetical protein
MISILFSIVVAQASDWRTLPVCEAEPVECERIYHTEPKPTRNPTLQRFTDPTLNDGKWIPLHILRLQDSSTPEATQLALINVLSKSELTSVERELIPLYSSDSAELRAAMTELLPNLSIEVQKELISALMIDADWLVRSETVRAIARHLGSNHTEVLIMALQDPEPEIRFHAVKGLGWNNIIVPIESLTPLLHDKDARVRLNTLRTIDRLYPGSAVKMNLLESMLDDPDPKVQREILRIKKAH